VGQAVLPALTQRRSQRGSIRIGNAGVRGNIGARLQLFAIALEVRHKVAAVLKAVHDIGEAFCVYESERVSALVNAGQVNDCVAKQMIAASGFSDIAAHRTEVRKHVDIRPAFSVHHIRHGLAIEVRRAVDPMNPDLRMRRSGAFLENERAFRFALPRLERPASQFRVPRLARTGFRDLRRAAVDPPGVLFRRAGHGGATNQTHQNVRDHATILLSETRP